MRPHAINVARHQPPSPGGSLRPHSSRAYPLPIGWVERLAESHQFRLGDRVLLSEMPRCTDPRIAMTIVGLRRQATRPEYEVRTRSGYTCWLPEFLIRRVSR